MIQCVFDRLLQCECVNNIIIATSLLSEDDLIAEHFISQGVKVFRGSPEDPLDRYYNAAKHHRTEHVMRSMADCPFIDPNLIDQLAKVYFSATYDFCHLVGEFPSGLDTTMFTFECLEKAWKESNERSDRKHITSYMTNNPKLRKIGAIRPLIGLYHYRRVVDHPEDYEIAKAVYVGLEHLGYKFRWKNITKLLEHQSEVFAFNS